MCECAIGRTMKPVAVQFPSLKPILGGVSRRTVFHDPSGRRHRFVRGIGITIVAVLVILGGSFAIGVLQPATHAPLPLGSATPATVRTTPAARVAASPASNARTATGPIGTAVSDPITAAFAVQWDPGSRAAIGRIGDRLDWVIVEGAFLGRGAPGALTITLDRDLLDAAQQKGAGVHLMVTNFAAGAFDPTLVESLLRTPERRTRAVDVLVEAVKEYDLRGITLDFERLRPASHDAVLALLRDLRARLDSVDAVVSVALPVALDAQYPMEQYAQAAHYIIPMLYDEHAGSSDAGPVASMPWFTDALTQVVARVPATQLLIGIGQYGYHWRSDRQDGVTVSASEAMALGRTGGSGPAFDRTSRTPHAEWQDAQGVAHALWYLDATTAWNQISRAARAGAAGTAIWRLGSEDETLWRVLGRRGLEGTPSTLQSLPPRGVAVLHGDGEILSVEGRDGVGHRAITTDAQREITDSRLVTAPGGYVVTRAGTRDRRVALTFDDGPDPAFTAQILDTLAARKAVASFFVVGRQVQQHPDLARRIVTDGHEIGNHTFSHPDLAGLSETAVRMELATAERVIEAVTGRRPMLFRPPFIGDARPATEERLRPMAVATSLGLRTAGLEVDTRDWQLTDPDAIVQRALANLDRGRTILLHDGGGDRAATVSAVGPLIDSLRARGYALTTVAGLLGMSRDAGSPAIPESDAAQRWLNAGALTVASVTESLLVGAFLLALVLGTVRLVGIMALAAIERSTRRFARRAIDAEYRPRVTVVIPAYSEAAVIARTVRSVRAQQYPYLEIVVIDDGSTDDTLAAARAGADDDARVRCIRQSNGGKASALNTGMQHATGEVIVVVDADTMLEADAIRHLVRPLSDTRVGAVAGNAKVGNRVNLVTRWQSVEYVTSQNLDRRAFALLDCITVVPGAIGAWRREAILAAGGFSHDTLAEDQDLTMTLLRRGQRIAMADQAIAWTEAPETLRALLSQRFRWSFGTLQCAWKHRAAMHDRSTRALGLVGLPNVWLFQLLFPLLAPAADVALLVTIGRYLLEAPAIGAHAAWAHATPTVALYALFLAIDVVTAVIGLGLERRESLWQAWLVPLQRIAYRQVLYVALLKAVRAAITGWSPAWGKLARTGRVADTTVAA
jgi:peptidoglycan-N-acetylglucosamine deacetylase